MHIIVVYSNSYMVYLHLPTPIRTRENFSALLYGGKTVFATMAMNVKICFPQYEHECHRC